MHLDSFNFIFLALFPLSCFPIKKPKYSYQYKVGNQDDKVHFGLAETRQGDTTRGSYKVLLPDGRTQVVQYNVLDRESGYSVKVNYENNNVKTERKREIQKKTFIKPLRVRDKGKDSKTENKITRYILENIYSDSDFSSKTEEPTIETTVKKVEVKMKKYTYSSTAPPNIHFNDSGKHNKTVPKESKPSLIQTESPDASFQTNPKVKKLEEMEPKNNPTKGRDTIRQNQTISKSTILIKNPDVSSQKDPIEIKNEVMEPKTNITNDENIISINQTINGSISVINVNTQENAIHIPQTLSTKGVHDKKEVNPQKITNQKHFNISNGAKVQIISKQTVVKGYPVKPVHAVNRFDWPHQEKDKYTVPRSQGRKTNIRMRKPLLQKVDSSQNVGGFYFKCLRTFLNNLLPFDFWSDL